MARTQVSSIISRYRNMIACLDATIGDACNDDDITTFNDQLDELQLRRTPTACTGIGDNDGDGVRPRRCRL